MPAPSRALLRRLRLLWRSAGWPSHDALDVELLAAGWVTRVDHGAGRETLRLTELGIAALAESQQSNRRALGAHEALVERVAREMGRAGRIVWRGLALRSPVPQPDGSTRWVMAMPDVYSIRHTTLEDQVQPVVHEVKVSRADLFGDLRQPAKRAAYLGMASECWYVIRAGIAAPDEIPIECGVIEADELGSLEVRRPAPRRSLRVPLAVWMALARATPVPVQPDDDQLPLASVDGEEDVASAPGHRAGSLDDR